MEKQPSPDLSVVPSVDRVLAYPEVQNWLQLYGHTAAVAAIRAAMRKIRDELAARSLTTEQIRPALIAYGYASLQSSQRSSMRPLINLTGTILHTNLGRAILSRELLLEAVDKLCQPCNLEFDLDVGKRGDRDDHLASLLGELTGAEAATVVNNNAAAVLLILNTLALRKEVIVSRGELVEIGGSFRIPEIMTRAGARLREVGTTNRTHEEDYRDAISARTGLIMKVHASNFEIRGFTAQVGVAELAQLASARALPLAVDLGSGALIDLQRFGLPKEPTPREMLDAGADLVAFSGDKLMGGPQAGIVVGKKTLIDQLKRNPLKRALRIDKMTLALLEATLRCYRQPERLAERLPALRQIERGVEEIEAQALRVLVPLQDALSGSAEVGVARCISEVGSGALPSGQLESRALRIAPLKKGRGAGSALQRIAAALRALPLPVIGRIEQDALWLDLRCLDRESEFVEQLAALKAASRLA